MVTYRVWRDPPKGSDTFRSFQSAKGASKYAKKLYKAGQLNDVVIYKKGKGEFALNKEHKMKLNKALKRK